ncbi:S9 family peptidase [Paraglaciecola aquimarina]|uniref:S9 family peptidase n=1 Tax=Paraglaciecola aquimarina TaxID=1235557 RepID=A0ABU3SWB4_9ALTE|nr:S9 family peptidase [Paraglaciecola aquimarina]MDU0354296.1 S9 family peptidase [Paraglaciecola aquimarina]
MKTPLFVTSLYLLLLSFYSSTLNAESIPLAHFAELPMVESPSLSPNGENIVAVSSYTGEKTIVVAPYDSIEFTSIVQLHKSKDRIESVQWANNDRILVYATYPKVVFGKRVRIGRLFAVNKDGTDLRQLQLNKLQRHDQAELFSDLKVLSILPNDYEHILVQTYTGRDKSPAVFKFNIFDGSTEKVVSAAEEIDSWVSDLNGNVRIGIKREYDNKTEEMTTDIFYRKNIESTEWENIYSYRSFKDFYVSPIAISDDNKTLYVFSDFEVYKDVIRKFDIEKREFGEIVFQQDKYDVDSAIIRDGRFVGAAYTDDFYRIEYFDEALKARQELITKTFSQYQSYIVSNNKDKTKFIVLAMQSNSPSKYFLVDLASKKANFWLSKYAHLENKKLTSKQSYSFSTQDGTELYGYFTPGSKGKDSPLIVFPHGGPGARDTMDFDIWVQMLNRRGYAVLQVNFRGSTGYGNSYETSGRKQWGKLMQNDVYEAIDWVKSQRLADTTNMCMVGGSYGGYVALVAGYQKPDWFKCIVSVAGISDLTEMVEKDSYWDGLKVNQKITIGDVDDKEERKDMDENSAINHITAYKAPVLLIHGENDQRVHYSQSEDMYKALKKKRKQATLLLLEDGTHFIDDPKNRTEAFEAIDKFLGKHL